MASNRNFLNYHEEEASSSSSRSPNEPLPPTVRDEADELDFDFQHDEPSHARSILGDDPLNGDIGEVPMSFKRKHKQSIFSQPNRMLAALTGNRLGARSSASGHSSTGTATPTLLQTLDAGDRDDSGNFGSGNGSKDGVPLDWYVEGPGRRVGYEDLTAIDWIFEYTKERQRLRVLYSNSTGIIGYIRQLADSSQVWIILVLTGIAVGALAAGIDVVSDWLGDLKTGYCASGPDGGAFYLNKQFCCMGYDQGDKCLGWKPWAAALGIGTSAGKWFIEYFFFLVFSVSV
jgi:chloride channel 3/4/5